MDRWVLYAILSMVFAGCTSVVAKLGLRGISSDLGLAVRTSFVFLFIWLFTWKFVPLGDWQKLTWNHVYWLALSAVTTTISWIFYYKAIQEGNVSTVALIDKGSVVVAILLASIILGEHITWRVGLGLSFIITGLLIISRK